MEANCFTILYWFCHTLTWIRHRCTCVPYPEYPSHLPLHPIPLFCFLFLFFNVFISFWYQDDSGFLECLWECISLFSLLQEFEKGWKKPFFLCLLEFVCETIWTWAFVCNGLFYYRCYFTSSYLSVEITYFFLSKFWWALYFYKLVHSL